MFWFCREDWQRRIKNSREEYGCKLSDRVLVLLHDVFPEQHPRCFSKALRWDGLVLCFCLIGMLGWSLSVHSAIFIGFSSIVLKICSPNLACLFFLIIGLIHSVEKRSHYWNWRIIALSITMSILHSQKIIFVSSCFSNNALLECYLPCYLLEWIFPITIWTLLI